MKPMKRYNILWIDDSPEAAIIDEAYFESLDIETRKTSREGLEELEKRLFFYDGVILDAKVFNQTENEEASLAGLQNSIARIKELASRRVIPYFIYSGHLSDAEKSTLAELYGAEKIYIKAVDDITLYVDIKKAADKLEETQIRHEFNEVFEVCQDEYLGVQNLHLLMKLLIYLKSSESLDQDNFNTIRKLLEAVVTGAEKYGLIHERCNGNLTGSLKFLAGHEVSIPPNSSWEIKVSGPKCMPELIANSAFYLKDIANLGSHYQDDDKSSMSKLSELQSYVSKPYLVKALIYQLLDVFLWFKSYIDKNPDAEINKSKWNEPALPEGFDQKQIAGEIEQDSNRNYCCSGILLAYKYVEENGFKVGDKIMITKTGENSDVRSNSFYPSRAIRFQKLP